MLTAAWISYRLKFRNKAKTSRAEMTDKETFFVVIKDSDREGIFGIGECALFRGLSNDDTADYEKILDKCCKHINEISVKDIPYSSIRFGFETALSDLYNGGTLRPFSTEDNISVKINGLVWMADKETMAAQAATKIADGFNCVKLKIGGIDFEQEIDILRHLRKHYPADLLEIRLDANGAFSPQNALSRLERLSEFGIHSIEQPIRQRQPLEMQKICRESPIAIALDEELIGITPEIEKRQLLSFVNPQYIILKPSLCGGFAEADEWIKAACDANIGWWATSALESDIGLNAIYRWVGAKHSGMPQGLGTGLLYTNNIGSPLRLIGDHLTFDRNKRWDLTNLSAII